MIKIILLLHMQIIFILNLNENRRKTDRSFCLIDADIFVDWSMSKHHASFDSLNYVVLIK